MANKAKKIFRISGRIIDRKTRRGVAGLRVEAWDKDLILDDLVGSAVTDERGAFRMKFDESYFRELFLDRRPDLFFKVFHKGELLKSTEDSVLWNVKVGETAIVIEIDAPLAERRRRPTVQVAVYDHKNNLLPNARVTLKPLVKKPGRIINIKFDKQWQVYQTPAINPGNYLLQAEAEGFESDQREVQVDPAGLREKFILGKKGMPFYYRDKVKVPFEPRHKYLAVSVKPGITKEEEQDLMAAAAKLKLRPQKVEEPVLNDNVRVFKYPERLNEASRQKIQKSLSGHQSVRIAGPVVHLGNRSVSFLTNELIVKFKVEVSQEEAYKIAKEYGLNITRSIPYAGNAYLMRAATASYDLLKICDAIVKTELVEYAEPNMVTTAELDYTPNDFLFASQSHHQIIDSEGAWDITRGDNSIIIAVCDSGCDIDHQDFTNDPALGWTKVYNAYDFLSMDDDPTSDSHGSKSCGIATANADNNEGVAGVAPDCRLMPLRYASGTDLKYADMYAWIAGFDPGWIADGTNYPLDTVFPDVPTPGADVISNSYGKSQVALDGLMKDALDHITTFGRSGKGCIVVFSVGNGDSDFTTYRQWAAYEKTIAVASSAISPPDAAEVKVSTSNYGSLVDVCAPGGGPSGGVESRSLSTTNVGSGDTAGSAGAGSLDYDDFGQTSCACPQVSGVAALMLSANPSLTWIQVRQILRDTAVQIDTANTDPVGQWVDNDFDGVIDFSPWYGHGRINAQAAVQAAQDLVGIDPLDNIDTWIKENSTDIGDVPESPPYYSPDVWVRNTAPVLDNPAEVTIHQSPIRGQDNWVYVNVRNRGALDSLDIYVRISITRWANTQYVYPDDFMPTGSPSTYPPVTMAPGTYLIGEVHIDSIPAGGVETINTVWPAALVPPATVVVDGVLYSWADSCLLVEVSPHDGPTPTGNNTWDNNNLCQKNLTIVDPADNDDMAIAFVVGNRTNEARINNLRIDRKRLPAEVVLFIDYVDTATAKKVLNFLDDANKGTQALNMCDLTILHETEGKLYCHQTDETSHVAIPPKTRFTFPCCGQVVKGTGYHIKPVQMDNRLLFLLPTVEKVRVPVLRKQREYQIMALVGKGLQKLKKGEYQIDIYQEDMKGNIEGGVNFMLRKR